MTQPGQAPGFYPDPTMPNYKRYWDGNQWTEPVYFPPGPVEPIAVKRKRNPLFFVLAVLSALPTLVFMLAYIGSEAQSNLAGFFFLWSFMWTWVWWKMSDRYR